MGNAKAIGGNFNRKVTRLAMISWSRDGETEDDFKRRMSRVVTQCKVQGKEMRCGEFMYRMHPKDLKMRWSTKFMEQKYA